MLKIDAITENVITGKVITLSTLELSLILDKWNNIKNKLVTPLEVAESWDAIDTFMNNLTEGSKSVSEVSKRLFSPRDENSNTLEEIMDFSTAFDTMTEDEDVEFHLKVEEEMPGKVELEEEIPIITTDENVVLDVVDNSEETDSIKEVLLEIKDPDA